MARGRASGQRRRGAAGGISEQNDCGCRSQLARGAADDRSERCGWRRFSSPRSHGAVRRAAVAVGSGSPSALRLPRAAGRLSAAHRSLSAAIAVGFRGRSADDAAALTELASARGRCATLRSGLADVPTGELRAPIPRALRIQIRGGRGTRDLLSVDPEHLPAAPPVSILFTFGPDARIEGPACSCSLAFRLAARAADHEFWKLH